MKHFTALFLTTFVSAALFAQEQSVQLPPKPSTKSIKQREESKIPEKKPDVVAPDGIPLIFLTEADIRYPSTSDGRNHTIALVGNPRKEELYVTRTIIPKGKKIEPHIHTDARTVVVLRGTYYYGIGEKFDEDKMKALPPGSFYTEPAGEPHYTWAKNDEVIVQTTAVGPSGTRLAAPPDQKADTEKKDKTN